MGIHADKTTRTDPPQTVVSSRTQENGVSANGPAAATYQSLKSMADQSQRVTQLKRYQTMSDQAVIQLEKWSTGALDGKETDISWQTTKLDDVEVGIEMEATLLGPDHKQGTPPKSGAQKKLMNQLPTKPKNDNEYKYVRGHLLNDNLGGEGEPYNLFPITANANKEHERVIESQVKQWVNQDKQWVYYHVKVTDIKSQLKSHYVDAVFDCKASILDKHNKPINTIKARIVSDYGTVKKADERDAIDNEERTEPGAEASKSTPCYHYLQISNRNWIRKYIKS